MDSLQFLILIRISMEMNKKLFIGYVLFCSCCQSWGVNKTNVLVIVADDLGRDVLGCYGGTQNITPYLDKLSEDGIRFTDAYCTSASSAASRAVILTGQYGHAINCLGHNGCAPVGTISLAEVMSDSGYRTGQCGKLHVQPESVFHFDNYFKADPRNGYEMAEACKEFIISKEEKPFFLYFCPIDPHRSDEFDKKNPYQPNLFGNKIEGYKNIKNKKCFPEDIEVPYFLPDTKACREELVQYNQSVSRLDEGIGHLLDILKTCDKYDNTLIIFISDNGIAFPGAKTNMYQPAMNLPCIVKLPYQKNKGMVSHSCISWVDLTPTLAEFVGWNKKNNFMGHSFMVNLDNPQKKHNNKVFGSHIYHETTMYYPMRMIIKGDYKLIYNIAYRQPFPYATDLWTASTWQFFIRETAYKDKNVPYVDGTKYPAPYMRIFPNNINYLDIELLKSCHDLFGKRTVSKLTFRPQFELYNLKEDPYEINNLVDVEKYKMILVELKNELQEFQAKTNDPWACKWFYE